MKHIVIVCDSPRIPTGYARIGRFVAKTLHDAGYRITYFPCNADNPDGEKYPYTILPHNVHDRYFNQSIVKLLVQLKPSLVLVFGEFGFIGYVGEVCRVLNIQSAYYIPVEGRGYPPPFLYAADIGQVIDLRTKVMQYHHLIAYSDFGRGEVHKILPGAVEAVIPHPVDTKMFKPLDKAKCFDIYLGEAMQDYGFEGTFVVGGVYRNHRRKGTDLLLRGFKRFLQYERPEKRAILYLVTDQYDAYGFNLQGLVKDTYELSGRVVLAPTKGGRSGPADNALSEIYNCFDVHCCPFRAEGFGLTVLESLASGIRTLCTKFASPASYAAGVADFVTPVDYEPLVVTNCEWAVVHPDDIAKGLLKLYNEDTKSVYQAGVDLAATFSLENVAKQWLDYIGSLDIPDVAHVEEFKAVDPRQQAIDEYLGAL
jgi:glycosyltransferase involved in cell wall biosynthesis